MSSSYQLDLAFQGAEPPGWLRRFAAEPLNALEDLLLGRAALGHLSAGEPVELTRTARMTMAAYPWPERWELDMLEETWVRQVGRA